MQQPFARIFQALFQHELDVTNEEFEIREAIIEIMSEVLPVYEGCLTVYDKSLRDWLI
jgi:hypothetical protein